jgi:ubiquinone/menaquinone biosynthesis C-methylase UbiE
MRSETLSLLSNPYTGEPLRLEENQLVDIETNQSFQIKNGIPIFTSAKSLKGRSSWYRHFYDMIAFAYDGIVNFGNTIKINTEGVIRKEYFGKFDIRRGDKVLETAIGTASNLFFLPPHGDYYGIDISWGMLKRAQKRLIDSNRKAELFQGDGAYLPFKDDTFDLVFHMGGLQFYSEPYRGVSEMARVAKSGTTIHILDEIRSIARTLKRNRIVHPKSRASYAFMDLHLLAPDNMDHIRKEKLPEKDYYLLTFQKP